MIPKSKETLKDTFIAVAFMAMGAVMPGSLLTSGFQAHMGGIAMGIGIGWLLKSYISYGKAESQITNK